MTFQRYFTFLFLAAVSAGMAYSQEQSPLQKTPGAKVADPAPLYQSAFSDYKSFREPEVMSWRTSNDLVRGAGGMDGMGGMGGHDMSKMNGGGGKSGSEMNSVKPGAAEESAMPAHDMGSMKNSDRADKDAMKKTRPAATVDAKVRKNPAGNKKSMPAHDMGKMSMGSDDAMKDMPEHGMGNVHAPSAAGRPAPASMPPAEARDSKKSMPGHDMANMGKSLRQKSASGTPEPAAKPAVSEQPMDHSKMKNKE